MVVVVPRRMLDADEVGTQTAGGGGTDRLGTGKLVDGVTKSKFMVT